MLNTQTQELFDLAWQSPESLGIRCQTSGGARVIDAGVEHTGSLAAGVLLAKLCLANRADVTISPHLSSCSTEFTGSNADIVVQTDSPLLACLGAQYAGWPVSCGDYFAMASGPMRALRGREEMLLHLELTESSDVAVGVLESETLPGADVIQLIASDCGIPTSQLCLALAPSTSIAGSVQVVARSIETAMHKLHALEFDVRSIVSAIGTAPLPPPAKRGKTVKGIGRTNDAILYGGRVTLWVDVDDEAIEAVIAKVPSQSSKDYGRPFADVFKDYGYDFYKVDPMLFSPAIVAIHNLRSGRSWQEGRFDLAVMRQSFLS
jgi:methenyltetrahydromethanopterin cyclohydrolase